jgi:hypothetical protein
MDRLLGRTTWLCSTVLQRFVTVQKFGPFSGTKFVIIFPLLDIPSNYFLLTFSQKSCIHYPLSMNTTRSAHHLFYLIVLIINYHNYGHYPSSTHYLGRYIMSRIVIVILIFHRHKPIDSINLLGS